MRTCPKCMAENPDTARFCKECASSLQQSGARTCPSGRHTMDPTWTECVYCKQEGAASTPPPVRPPTLVEEQTPPPRPAVRQATHVESAALPPRPPRPAGPDRAPAMARPASPRAQTVFRAIRPGDAADGPNVPPVARDRRIVGALITYSWNPEGRLFPVREGRNLIGRDGDCDICIPEDDSLSGRNSHITFRQNFVVGDLVSMTGTDLNGVPIEEQFKPLANYASIRAGSTYFTFIVMNPTPAATSSASSTSDDASSPPTDAGTGQGGDPA